VSSPDTHQQDEEQPFDGERFASPFRPLPDQPARRDQQSSFLKRKLGPVGGAIALFLAKFKTVILIAAKFKLFTVGGTMLISIAAYAWIFGWWFAVGFVLLIFCHEMGHAIELRRQGVKASAPVFIPFLGAVIGMREMPRNAWNEALMALAGPFYGSLAAAVVWLAAVEFHSPLLKALAYTGFFINLFNLLPLTPLDGGRVSAALHPALWLLGILAVGIGIFLLHSPFLAFILIIGLFDVRRRWRQYRRPEGAGYYKLSASKRFAVAVAYFGLALVLGLAVARTYIDRNTLHHHSNAAASQARR
jgi:Zn-dependent protease